MTSLRQRTVPFLALLCTASLLLGCSSDDDSPEDDAGSSDTEQTITGEAVRIGVILPTETSAANFPEMLAGVEAGVNAINERGGISGQEVTVDYCNERNDANAAAACARQMVDDGVVATISTFSNHGQAIYDVLEPAGIPQIGVAAITPKDFSSPISYPIDAALLAFVGCGALFPEAAGVNPIAGVQFDLDAAGQGIALTQAGAASAGVNVATVSKQPVTVADLAPAVSDVKSSGAEGVVLVLPEQQSVQLIQTAAQLGDDFAYCHSPAGISPNSLRELGDAASRYYTVSSFPALNQRDEIPELERMFDEFAAAEEAGIDNTGEDALKGSSLTAWLGTQVLEQVAAEIDGDITAETLRDALDGAKVTVDGLLEVDYTTPSNLPNPNGEPLTRVFNGTVRLLQWDADAGEFFGLDDVEPIDALAILSAASG